ncbi:MAG: hypothetical protein CMF28_02035 [Kiritimatiellaceae bacterium]|nr:hypothetical protein [Kiritimatiellaceae bacterium]RZO87480.1 MAG: helix-turn-helix domain-containing protein [Kiritimatiellaceae bacterium]|tara:strand:+ start:5048 stop:6193 length:1146 start_codon:yes stop_codon:yes gene_type:complete
MISQKYILLLLEWYDYRIHKGVAQIAREHGWQLNCPKNPTNNIGFLEDWKGDGCIALLECADTLNYFKTHRIPLIDLGLSDHNLPIQRVVTDNKQTAYLAAEHFRDQGYREVFALSPAGLKMYEERLQYFQAYMEKDGGTVHVMQSDHIYPGVITELKQEAKRRKKNIHEFSIGFLAYEDAMAAELISLLLKHELRVPENVAVLGVDNDDLINSGLTLGLSSIDCDLEGLGIRAAQELKKILNQPTPAQSPPIIRHKPRGVIARHSTDCYAVRNPIVSEALHWIHHHFQRGIQATDVAHAVGITQQGLQKAFQESYIRTPGQEIRYQRCKAVAQLLECTNATLSEIALNCGYYSVDTLIKGFKNIYHITPGQYRKKLQKSR